MSKKTPTAPANVNPPVDVAVDNQAVAPVVAAEAQPVPADINAPTEPVNTPEPADIDEQLYDAVLTRTVKHKGEFLRPGTTLVGIDLDFASELEEMDAADITESA